METQYTLEKTEDPERPLVITKTTELPDSKVQELVFSFKESDANFAGEILDNLNAGRAWEPEAELATLSLEDTDELASSA